MTKRMTLEVIAPTVEEAIEQGLDKLGLGRDEVDVEILDEGKRNLFRFATRQARVKLTVRTTEQYLEESSSELEFEETDDYEEDDEEVLLSGDLDDEEEGELSEGDLDYNQVKTHVEAVVKKLLQLMQTYAIGTVEVKKSEDDDRQFINVEIEGDDLSFLIGRRAETLNAIQYMISLMVSHKFSSWVPVRVDIQNYRSRREKELQKLARRMADQVVSTGRKQTLEPMPANERRIIHIELRKRDDVYTESVGEDPYRKVFIHPAD